MYLLLLDYISCFKFLNIFRYLTFRVIMGMLTAFLITMIAMPFWIKFLVKKSGLQPLRSYLPAEHDSTTKSATPAMGGVIIILSVLTSILLWSDFLNIYVLGLSGVFVLFGALGLMDDLSKILKKNHHGIRPRVKFVIQFFIAFAMVLLVNYGNGSEAYRVGLSMPFYKNLLFYGVYFYTILRILAIIGCGNAVNLTDGLDGLAIVPVIFAVSCLSIITYLSSNQVHSGYLFLYHVKGAHEVVIFGAAIVGSAIGFLWYNAKPADIFMGDVGSLSLGGAIGAMAVIIKQEILLILIGGVFVVETLSVIIQVASFKATGKRVFRMSPLHHHFEMLGWNENKIVIRFWILALMFDILAILTIKIR